MLSCNPMSEQDYITIHIIELKARRDAADDHSMNIAMAVESKLLTAQIESLESRLKEIEDQELIKQRGY